MLNRVDKNEKRQKRHLRSRRYIIGTAEKPRLNVYRSLSNIYAQVINDETGETIAAASTVEKDLKENYGGNIEAAKAVGKAIAEKALAKGVKEVVFDRGVDQGAGQTMQRTAFFFIVRTFNGDYTIVHGQLHVFIDLAS